MELTVHPLLHLVEDNRNGLKMILKHYIDYTVDDQFDHLKNSILKMILNGLINPLYEDTENALTSSHTAFPTDQSNVDHENSSILHHLHSNDHLTTHEQNILPGGVNALVSSPLNTTQLNSINGPSLSIDNSQQLISQEDSSTNVHCNDAPNYDENEQTNNTGIEVNDDQNVQDPFDEFDEFDDDLSYQIDPQQHTKVVALVQQANHQNDPSNSSIVPSTMNNNSNKHLTTNQITLSPTNQFQTCTKQSNSNLTNLNEDSDYEGCINDDKEEDVEEDDETDEQIEIDQGDEEFHQLDELQKANTIQPPIGQSQVKGKSTTIQRKLVNRKTQINKSVIRQSIPSNSGLHRSSGRKRIPKKMFGDDDQSNVELKRKRRETKSKQSKILKNREKIQQKESVTKQLQTTTLVEVNCTEPGCKMILNSRELLKRHLLKYHGKKPYDDNVKHNQHGQTKYKYACTECDVVCISALSLTLHWRHTHEAGEFACSDCEFVANFRRELLIHQQANHLSSRFECTYEGCSKVFHYNYDLERHQQIHSGERQFVCAWDSCELAFHKFCDAIQHVRTRHFYLPESVGEHNELKYIIDERDPKVFVKDSQTCRSKV